MKEQEIIRILGEFSAKEETGFGFVWETDFPAIAKRISELDGWVKVSERYPDKYGAYWVCRKDGKMHLEIWNGTGFSMNQKVITHWKNLPSNP